LQTRYGVSPDKLSDEEWFDLYAKYQYVEKLEFKNRKAAVIGAIAEIMSDWNTD
jgi:hypothetical protein